MLADKPTELLRIKLKTWTRQPVPMISKHSAHLTPLSVDFRTWLWRYTYLLLLISMLWHRQAIFKSKGDKLCSSLTLWPLVINLYSSNEVIMSQMASQITSVSVVCSTICSGAIKENIKVLRHWPLWGESTGDRWIPLTKGQWRGHIFIWWRHHGLVRTCHAKPLPEAMLAYWWSDLWQIHVTSRNGNQSTQRFFLEYPFETLLCKI